MSDDFVNKLREYFDSKGFTQKAIAEKLNVNPAYVNKLLTGKKAFGKKTAHQFQDLFGLSESWLLTGNGGMLVTGQNVTGSGNTVTQNNGDGNTTTNTITNNYKGCGGADKEAARNISDMGNRIAVLEAAKPQISNSSGRPYYNIDFIGGFDTVFNNQITTPAYNIDYPPCNREGVVWCNLSGHSMEPKICHNDKIALRELYDWESCMLMGKIYAIVTTSDLRTVKIVRKGSSDDVLRLVPVNTLEYDEQEIPKNTIIRVFELLGSIEDF